MKTAIEAGQTNHEVEARAEVTEVLEVAVSIEVAEAVVNRVVTGEDVDVEKVAIQVSNIQLARILMDRTREFNLLMLQTRIRNKDFKVTIDLRP